MDRMIELGADVGARNNVSILGFSSCYRAIGLIEYLKQACPRLKLLQVAEKEENKAREGVSERVSQENKRSRWNCVKSIKTA